MQQTDRLTDCFYWGINGDLDAIRTRDPQIRNLGLVTEIVS
jgi:hypothetical protein